MTVEIVVDGNDREGAANLAVIGEWDEVLMHLALHIADVDGPGSKAYPIILRFPGTSRHPGGCEAPCSWFNGEGKGMIRIREPNQILILPLTGWAPAPGAEALPREGRRGPTRSLDLWLAIAALHLPMHFTAQDLQKVTGANRFTAYEWLDQSVNQKLIHRLSSKLVGGHSGRGQTYIILRSQVGPLCEFIRATWMRWSGGDAHKRFRPVRRYFVSNKEWPEFAAENQDAFFATGVTWLEGHDGGRSALLGSGNIPRLSFLCSESAWIAFTKAAGLVSREQRNRSYESEAMILTDAHPAWKLMTWLTASAPAGKAPDNPEWPAALIVSRGKRATWPDGLRVLDGMRDAEPRVREAAETAWGAWVQQQTILHAPAAIPKTP